MPMIFAFCMVSFDDCMARVALAKLRSVAMNRCNIGTTKHGGICDGQARRALQGRGALLRRCWPFPRPGSRAGAGPVWSLCQERRMITNHWYYARNRLWQHDGI